MNGAPARITQRPAQRVELEDGLTAWDRRILAHARGYRVAKARRAGAEEHRHFQGLLAALDDDSHEPAAVVKR